MVSDGLCTVGNGQCYQHYKNGHIYRVQFAEPATHTETDEKLVIYQRLNGGPVWARPESVFFADVTLDDGTVVPRFRRVETFDV